MGNKKTYPKSYFSLIATPVAEKDLLKDKWILNSWATRRMTHNTRELKKIRGTDESVEMEDGTVVQILKIRTTISTAIVGGIYKIISIEDVAFVPEIATNLV